MTLEKHAARTTTFEAIQSFPAGRSFAIEDSPEIDYFGLRLSDTEFDELKAATQTAQANKPE